MKNHSLLLLGYIFFCIQICACGQESQPGPTTPDLPDAYESCCGAEPVEFNIGNSYVYVPNVFTPNGDGINDYFVPSLNDNVEYFDAYLIYTDVGDTLLFDRAGFIFGLGPISVYAWDGNRKDGTPYIGAFRYEMTMIPKNSTNIFTVKGRACRIACGPDAAALKDKAGCFYPSQIDTTTKRLDQTIPNKEGDCFK